MKQFLLFLNKAYQNDDNISLASRSLVPPDYFFHGVGDFDVGQVGFGAANFTELFTTTPIYKRLSEIGYLMRSYFTLCMSIICPKKIYFIEEKMI